MILFFSSMALRLVLSPTWCLVYFMLVVSSFQLSPEAPSIRWAQARSPCMGKKIWQIDLQWLLGQDYTQFTTLHKKRAKMVIFKQIKTYIYQSRLLARNDKICKNSLGFFVCQIWILLYQNNAYFTRTMHILSNCDILSVKTHMYVKTCKLGAFRGNFQNRKRRVGKYFNNFMSAPSHLFQSICLIISYEGPNYS